MFKVSSVISFPSSTVFNEIIDCDSIDIISPFYSGWSIGQLINRSPSRIRFITRLPIQYHTAPIMLDNDPVPLKNAVKKLGDKIIIRALPDVHAKLFLRSDHAWFGSSNFTRNGFSGKGEVILKCAPPLNEFRKIFKSFLSLSKPVSQDNIDFLIDCKKAGLTKLAHHGKIDEASPDTASSDVFSYESFKEWLGNTNSCDYILQRIHNKNRMCGHVYSGFHGIMAFLYNNNDAALSILDAGTYGDEIIKRLASFIGKYGEKYGGPRGGTWNSKLSVHLGGTQVGGGAGDAVVKHLLEQVPRYMKDMHLL